MILFDFAEKAKEIFEKDANVIGLAVGGSWLQNGIDEYSDLDLLLVTRERISGDKEKMLDYAKQAGSLLSGFTGEHVGEPRLLICLYENQLLHVDIKFLTLEELVPRVETPHILFDKTGEIRKVFDNSEAVFPYPDYQWMEDRFWIWVHYALLKIGRGEYFEALDFFGFLRMVVLGPLLHIKNGKLPRGVRKVESELDNEDFILLKKTIPAYDRESLLYSLKNIILIYQLLRSDLFTDTIKLQTATEEHVLEYLSKIDNNK